MEWIDHLKETMILENSLWDWGVAIGLLFAVFVALKFLNSMLANKLFWLVRKANPELESVFRDLAAHTKKLFLFVMAIFAAHRWVQLPEKATVAIAKLAAASVVIQLGLWAACLIETALQNYLRRKGPEDRSALTTINALGFIVRLVLWSIVSLLVLDNLGINVTALVTGLGVGGIAVALAVQNVLGDILSSLSIVLDKPFVLGDNIIVDNFEGTVEHVGLKTTRIRALSGEQLIFSNSDLLKARIRNLKRMEERRICFYIGVTYQTSSDKLRKLPQVIKDVIEKNENARFDRAHFKSYGASSLDFEITYWVKKPDVKTYLDTQQAINITLFEKFETEGIEFAYPTQTIFVEKLPNPAS